MYNYYISFLVNHIKMNSAKKNLKFELLYTKKIFLFLKFLKSINYIYKFNVFLKKKKLYIMIFLYYFNRLSFVKNFKIISKPLKNYFISFSSLLLLTKRTSNSIYILSTSKGFLTHTEAIHQRTGGILLGFFLL
jgi:ribosomal protein S8